MKKNPNIVARNIHNTYYLIDIKGNYYNDICNLYETNEIGYFLWNTIEEEVDVEKMKKVLLNNIVGEYNIEVIESDINDFVETLKENGFIV